MLTCLKPPLGGSSCRIRQKNVHHAINRMYIRPKSHVIVSYHISLISTNLALQMSPFPATVSTRNITLLVGGPYKPSFATITGRGEYWIYTCVNPIWNILVKFSQSLQVGQKITHVWNEAARWAPTSCKLGYNSIYNGYNPIYNWQGGPPCRTVVLVPSNISMFFFWSLEVQMRHVILLMAVRSDQCWWTNVGGPYGNVLIDIVWVVPLPRMPVTREGLFLFFSMGIPT